MNPLEILHRTPKTNCGECGYPACLAFAAAVSRAGAEITLCPYIDLQGLEMRTSNSTKGDLADLGEHMAEKHDLALIKHLQYKVSRLDFSSIANALGAKWNKDNPDVLHLRYLGQNVILGKAKILMDDDTIVDPRDQILLYNYVHSCGGRKPDNIWIGMESLPNSISKVKTLATYCEMKIAEHLSGKPARILHDLGGQLDGYEGPADLSSSATSSIVVPVLPMVPQYLLFWEEEPDDGFAPKAKVLFDHHVLDFLDLESLVFSAERFAERLVLLLTKMSNVKHVS
ncbi:MAG: hypothetical protein AMJ61_10725 [Desulfobacterales bacterium SG8_35_2]|nr:MAG: hypothetical protein AMJ61_10725 [Desulfobacterales bacterium SG8_35_2]